MFACKPFKQAVQGGIAAQQREEILLFIRVMLYSCTGEVTVNSSRGLTRIIRQSDAAQVLDQFGKGCTLVEDALMAGSQHGEGFVKSGGGGR